MDSENSGEEEEKELEPLDDDGDFIDSRRRPKCLKVAETETPERQKLPMQAPSKQGCI